MIFDRGIRKERKEKRYSRFFYRVFWIALCALCGLLLPSCSKLGYGILLWSIEEPPVQSGTILPVYIKSNIENVYVIGIPETSEKIEIPLSQLEFCGGKGKAKKRSLEFAKFAAVYAENLQDGLPIRDNPDNGSRRVYRLRIGEIVKILDKVEGNPPISTTGDPLPGDWYKVLTSDGVKGFCFSYRLKLFEQTDGGSVISAPATRTDNEPDPDLEMILSRRWSPELYQNMINSRQFNIPELEKNYRFDPGLDSGVAKIFHPAVERDFTYNAIHRDGERSWYFDGTSLQMSLRTNSTLAVTYMDFTGVGRTILFTTLSVDVEDLIEQEKTRRSSLYNAIFNRGPVFTSGSYGTITFYESGEFSWTGYDLLVPQYIPLESAGNGQVMMDVFLPNDMERYTGAVNFVFTDITPARSLVFLYGLDNQGLRLEIVPDYGIENDIVIRRANTPMTMYFYIDTPQ